MAEASSRPLKSLIILGLILLALAALKLYSYLLFHSVAEVFSIVVACATFILAWHTRQFFENRFLVWIGSAHLFVAAIDLAHTLAYKHMGVFEGDGANLATQLWLAGRFLQAGAWLPATFLIRRKCPPECIFALFSVTTAGLFAWIFYFQAFPVAFLDDSQQLTPFKIYSEYAICAAFAVSGLLLWRSREHFDRSVLNFLLLSLAGMITAELSFTLYRDPFDVLNLTGHSLKFISYYLIYKAVVDTGLKRPYALLFRDLKRSEEALQNMNAVLEQRVAERTAVAENRAHQLHLLATELTQAEQRERRRLAQILHDHLQQLLVAARMHLGIARSRMGQAGAQEALETADDLLAQSIDASRSLTAELSPPVLHNQGLPAALQWLAEWKKEKHHLAVEVDVDQEANPSSESVRNLVFQVIWELLFNVVKHSGEKQAKVSLRQQNGTLHVTVEDRGKGFDPSAVTRSTKDGFGLASIRQRLDTIGGAIDIDSAPGRGTRIHLTAPMSLDPPVN